jgi:hypothetical protein
VEPEGSLACSQRPTTGPYPELDESYIITVIETELLDNLRKMNKPHRFKGSSKAVQSITHTTF